MNFNLLNKLRQLTSLPFFSRNKPLESPRQVIGWWEARRLPYNLIVGGTGILTCTTIVLIIMITNSNWAEFMPETPMIPIVLYGIMANICFTGGWMSELLVRQIWEEQGQFFGPIAFTLGVFFSMALTLLPAVFFGCIKIL